MSLLSIALLLVVAVVPPTFTFGPRYCDICKDHTMCLYQGIGPSCVDVGEGGVTETEKVLIVDLHNQYRRKIAKGLEKRGQEGPQPEAANMRLMMWDDELATIAQRWADQCRFQHDKCRKTAKYKVGQNLFWSFSDPIRPRNWTEAITAWYDEVELFDAKKVGKYEFNFTTGHYTQLVWHNSYAVGCGRRDYGGNKLYACDYGPAGNFLRMPMYEVGPACSKCPANTVCKDGLCAGTTDGDFSPAAPDQAPAQDLPPLQQPPAQHFPVNNYFQFAHRIMQNLSPPRKDAVHYSYGYGDLVKKQHDGTANKFNLIDGKCKAKYH
ncbi:UNVERIFIED_CONTAM: hypothetical protein PYX00_005457 [Menopon gallinae]|uniref:SCP domain-containing protein n=1 Tax=Menopon gallinae TaxID=328185 RepID=A0AAW2HSA1_9NEOP